MRHIPSGRAIAFVALLLALGRTFEALQLTIPDRVSKIEEKEYNMKAFATTSLSEAEWAGGALFDQRCAMCHPSSAGRRGAGPILNQDTLKTRGEARVRDMILKGSPRMPGWDHTFTAEQVSNVIAYLKTVAAASAVR